jgi:photosystem II stability/assembly factor-like uncharacterized protein
MVMAPDGSITMLCTQGGDPDPPRTLVTTSTDGGVTFGLWHATPDATSRVGAADATTLFAATVSADRDELWRSDNAGESWRLAADAPGSGPNSGYAPALVTFPVDSQTGYWLPGGATIFVTHDSGQQWSAHVPG